MKQVDDGYGTSMFSKSIPKVMTNVAMTFHI